MSNTFGIDLGTCNVKVFCKATGKVLNEKNTIAIVNKNQMYAYGDQAYAMYEKAPENVEILFPMKNGVIARFDDMQYLLGSLLKTDHQFARGAEYVIAVPTDVTEVEKKAFYDLVMHSEAKAKRVYGRDLTSGVPAHTEIQISLVRAAVKEPLEECAEAIRSMLTRTPPDVRRAIEARGIYLTGGVAGLKGFPTYLGERTGLKVFTVPDPELCAVKGLQKIILDKEYYKKLSYSMLDQNYRWLR